MAGTHGGVLHHNPGNAGVMTGEGFLFGPRVRLPGAEPPSFVGSINVLFKKACRASTRSFTDKR